MGDRIAFWKFTCVTQEALVGLLLFPSLEWQADSCKMSKPYIVVASELWSSAFHLCKDVTCLNFICTCHSNVWQQIVERLTAGYDMSVKKTLPCSSAGYSRRTSDFFRPWDLLRLFRRDPRGVETFLCWHVARVKFAASARLSPWTCDSRVPGDEARTPWRGSRKVDKAERSRSESYLSV